MKIYEKVENVHCYKFGHGKISQTVFNPQEYTNWLGSYYNDYACVLLLQPMEGSVTLDDIDPNIMQPNSVILSFSSCNSIDLMISELKKCRKLLQDKLAVNATGKQNRPLDNVLIFSHFAKKGVPNFDKGTAR